MNFLKQKILEHLEEQRQQGKLAHLGQKGYTVPMETTNKVNYILTNISGWWATFRPEDPEAPGYPLYWKGVGSNPVHELKVGFSGEWNRHLNTNNKYGVRRLTHGQLETLQEGEYCQVVGPNELISERDFAKDKNNLSALWLESKNCNLNEAQKEILGNTTKIYAGCSLEDFLPLIKQAGGEIYMSDKVREILHPKRQTAEEDIKRSAASQESLLREGIKGLTTEEAAEQENWLANMKRIGEGQVKEAAKLIFGMTLSEEEEEYLNQIVKQQTVRKAKD